MEVGPEILRGNKGIVAGVDEVSEILSSSGRVVVEHGGLTCDELGETYSHFGGRILVCGTIALRKVARSNGLLALIDNPFQNLGLAFCLGGEFIGFQDTVNDTRLIP